MAAGTAATQQLSAAQLTYLKRISAALRTGHRCTYGVAGSETVTQE